MLKGVNLAGDLFRVSGYGGLIRETGDYLSKVVPVKYFNQFIDPSFSIPNRSKYPSVEPTIDPDWATLIVAPPLLLDHIKTPHTFLYSMLEAYPAPREWVASINNSPLKALFTTSKFCVDSFVDGGVDIPVHLVYNIFDPALMPAKVSCPATCFGRHLGPYILYTGTALKRKGVDLLFEVAKLVPGVTFVIKVNLVDGIGFPMSKELFRTPNVLLLAGTMQRGSFNHLLQHANLGLYLARADTISKFPMEMAYYGIPTITGLHSGLAEWTPPEYGVASRPVRAEEVYEGLTWWEPDIHEAADKILKYLEGQQKPYDRTADLAKFHPNVVVPEMLRLMEEYI